MTFLPLQLPPGIVHGANPDDAAGRWYDGNLVRWRDGVMEPVGGWERLTHTPMSTPPRKIHQWRDNRNILHTLVGTDAKLRIDDDGNWIDITPADMEPIYGPGWGAGYGASTYGSGLYGVKREGPTRLQPKRQAWSFANWGEDVLVLASSDGRLFYHEATKSRISPTVVAGAPIGNRAVVVTPERHAMMILEDGRSIGWCSREAITDWNFSSVTNTAGKLPLQVETPLLNLAVVREGVLIWSETEAVLARYVNLPYIYGADLLGSANLYAPNSFAEFDGKCAWMDAAGFMLYQGGAITTLESPLTDYVFSDLDPTFGPRNAFAFANGAFNEVWWHYPSRGQQENDRFVMWNYVENWWSMGKLSRTAGFGAGAGAHPVLGGPNGHVYLHESGWVYDGFDAEDNIYIASGTVVVGTGENTVHISQLLPSNGANYDATKYTLYTRMTPAQPEIVNGPYLARADGYVDTRASGRDVRVKISAKRAGDWSIGRLRMKVATGGRR